MKLKNRIKKSLVTVLAVSMVSSLISMPVMAENDETSTRSVTFTVSAGDLLIATNPVPWSQDEETGEWDRQVESMGKVELVTASNAETAAIPAKNLKKKGHGEHLHCATIEKNEEYKAWMKKHPGSSQINMKVQDTAYEVGDLVWHGYDRDHKQGADVLMGNAPVYTGNEDAGKATDYSDGQPTEKSGEKV